MVNKQKYYKIALASIAIVLILVNIAGAESFVDNAYNYGCSDCNDRLQAWFSMITPALNVTKSADLSAYNVVGELITYTYTVTNIGHLDIYGNITVIDDHISSPISIPNNDLEPGQSVTGAATYKTTQNDFDNGSVTNSAYATATNVKSNTGFVTNSADATNNDIKSNTATATVNIAHSLDLAIQKSASPTTYSTVGQNIIYTYTLTNAGNVTILGNITVTDSILGVISIPSNSLEPGQSITGTAIYKITQQDLDVGSVTNSAYATNDNITLNMDSLTNLGNAIVSYNNKQVISPTTSVTIKASKCKCLGSTICCQKSGFPSCCNTVRQKITQTYNVNNAGNLQINTNINKGMRSPKSGQKLIKHYRKNLLTQ